MTPKADAELNATCTCGTTIRGLRRIKQYLRTAHRESYRALQRESGVTRADTTSTQTIYETIGHCLGLIEKLEGK